MPYYSRYQRKAPISRGVTRVRRYKRYSDVPGYQQTGVTSHAIEGWSAIVNTFPGGGSTATPTLINALSYAYTSGFFTDHVKPMYQQWRLKSFQAVMRFRQATTSTGSIFQHTLTDGAQYICGPRVSYVWDRQESYANVTGISAALIESRKGSQVVQFQDNQIYPIVNTKIMSYGAGDAGWLDVDAAPGAAPNTGAFFCPFLFMAISNVQNVTGLLVLSLEWSCVVECRGSKL